MDNFQPLLLNDYNEGKDWTGHQVRISQVLKRNEYTETGSSQIWEYMKELLEKMWRRADWSMTERKRVMTDYRNDTEERELLEERRKLSLERIRQIPEEKVFR